MLGIFKKKTTKNLNTWLDDVNKAYDIAFETHDISKLSEYVTRELAVELFQRIRSGQKVYSGLSKYRHTTWRKEQEDSASILILKIVTYDHIKVTRGIIANVGNDFTERWTILKDNGKLLISNIRRT